MTIVNMHEAKSQLSSLVEKALAGEEVIIGKAGKPLVKLIPIIKNESPRVPGRFKGQIRIADDFDAVDESLVSSFEGEHS
jgi:prevent-host-death family protein